MSRGADTLAPAECEREEPWPAEAKINSAKCRGVITARKMLETPLRGASRRGSDQAGGFIINIVNYFVLLLLPLLATAAK